MNPNNPNSKENQVAPGNSNISDLGQERPTESNAIQIPKISLPSGGGAIKGIDEKFKVNAANGTAGFTIPLPITPGRNGFSPELSLSYNSGSGNGPYGLGWSVGYPAIQRKTDKRIPRYRDELEEDIFMLSGVEDLVPYLENEEDKWVEKEYPNNGENGYSVKRYRPRIEGGFSRIEKIQHPNHGIYWKVTTGDNIATIYGRDPKARIVNPNDEAQIFRWLPEFRYDDKGNWIKYEYKEENLEHVPNEVFEKNRINGIASFTNRYLKKIKYGNRTAYYAYRDENDNPYDPREPENLEHFFELVMDYGEHDGLSPTPQEINQWNYRPDAFSSYRSGFEIRTNRLCERILMFHHFKDEKQFVGTDEEEDFGINYLIRSLKINYKSSSINGSEQAETTYLSSLIQSGYIRKPDGDYSVKSLPPIEFTYETLNWNQNVKTIDREQIVNAPVGLTNNYQWVDLYGEGISGILTEQGAGWYYKSNLGDIDEDGNVAFTVAKKVIPKPSFSGLANGVLSIQDLGANGKKQVVVNSQELKGYFELTDDDDWSSFQAFEHVANTDLRNPNIRLIDLNGDGQPDILMTEDNVFTWHPSEGKLGYASYKKATKQFDEEQGPAIVFADKDQSIFLADMSGDGLTDIIRIRNGEICYWSNLGYGHFNAKVTMGNAPIFSHDDLFNPQNIHLADVSGTGATDIIYTRNNKVQAFINLSGNEWSDVHEIEPTFPIDTNSKFSVIDLLGTGTSCIVWSSDLPSHAEAPMRYLDLMSSKKPHVLIHYKNNLGKETTIQYKSSTHFYLKDKSEGKPWITKLPFPVQVVSKSIVEEKISDVRFTTEYRYHHGYYDHAEREFRGFGMVEQIDSEFYAEWNRNNATNNLEESEELYQKPVLTKTWFHTGAFLEREKVLSHFRSEYWYEVYNRSFPDNPLSIEEPQIPDAHLSDEIMGLYGDEYREAFRACKGMTLRQEIFALDAPDNPTNEELQLQLKPYTVTTHNCNVQMLQPRSNNDFGVFIVTGSEAITIEYERDETDYRLSHSLNTKIDDLGNILESATISYGRNQVKADIDFLLLSNNITDFSEDVLNDDPLAMLQLQNAFADNIQAAKDQQTITHIIYTQNVFAKYNDSSIDVYDVDLPHAYRLRMPHETKTYELTGFVPSDDIFILSELDNALSVALEIGYHEERSGGMQSRLIEHVKVKYLDDNLNELDFGIYDSLGFPFENYQLVYTPELVENIYQKDGVELQVDGEIVSSFIEEKGNFSNINGDLWIRSGITHFMSGTDEPIANVKDRFFLPVMFEDPFGAITSVVYDRESFTGSTRNNDGYYLFIKSTIDAIDNKSQIDHFNFRTMSPCRMISINANPTSVLLDELGLVKAFAIEGNGVFTDMSRTVVNIIQSADNLSGLKEYTDSDAPETIDQMLNSATFNSTNTDQLKLAGNTLLKEASVRFVYDFHSYRSPEKKPAFASSIAREEHFADNSNSNIHFSFEYSDGVGNVVMTKVQAEPGVASYNEEGLNIEKDTGTDLRWVGNGRTVLNNKGNPVKQYEPYFSTNFLYEDDPELTEIGVTPILFYDSIGRLIRTEFPDGTLSRVEFDSWKQINYDQNDTVLESEWYNDRINNLIDDKLIVQGKDPAIEKQAAEKAAVHSNTPSSLHLDSLGRSVLSIANNGVDSATNDRLYSTFIILDIEGNTKGIKDARGNALMSYKYNMLGHRLYQDSMDAGERWVLNNLLGNPIHSWDSRKHVQYFEYDTANRPLMVSVKDGDGSRLLSNIYERNIYGEGQANEYQNNLRGQLFQLYDTAGRIQNLQFDYKGNLLETSREYNSNYKDVPNWISANLDNDSLFDSELNVYTSRIEYDALNRAINTITPDNSETKPEFNEAGLLKQVRVSQTGIAEKQFVKDITYDAKGQRERIIYGDRNGNNLATTIYRYDEDTFRILHLRTTNAGGDLLQDLYYTYDPVGNISEIEDKAIPTRFFNNFKIEPKGLYTYDALYRLIEAEGKEHAGQASNFALCDNWRDQNFLKSYSPGDDMAWRKYNQIYTYDPVGNILEINHNAPAGNWTRGYEYETDNNRIKESNVGGQTYTYTHHPQHGFINAMAHLSLMEWNFKDELQATARQAICNTENVEDDPPETTYYVYDGNGQRVRKVTENKGGLNKKEERLYLGPVEIYKKHSGNHRGLERTTLHVMDDSRRIAMVDSRNDFNDDTEQRTVRFQLSNHLGSASLELNDLGSLISYEEYHPYGTTAYQATNKDINATAKRYRYTGMERDEESGLAYHSARYYLSWLGRWMKPDPVGIDGGSNLYHYAYNNPIRWDDTRGTTPPVVVIRDRFRNAGSGSALSVARGISDDTDNSGFVGSLLDIPNNFGGFIGESWSTAGFRRELRDPNASDKQAGHFWSMVSWGMSGDREEETLDPVELLGILGGILTGGSTGAASGAGLGAILGGPVGAGIGFVGGGLAGGVSGGIIGGEDAASQSPRPSISFQDINRPDFDRGNISIRDLQLAIGHELYPDISKLLPRQEVPGGNAVFFSQAILQALEPTQDDLRLVSDILTDESLLSRSADATIDIEALRGRLQPLIDRIPTNAEVEAIIGRPLSEGSRPSERFSGNSESDLINSVIGLHFGALLEEGAFQNAEQAAQWMDRNVISSRHQPN